ncbi:MAG: sorbosone dehydrogenase family protein [Candidatus Omnitrophota bacterium]|nr:sorbosone dehydrogenase family protein [Candidatus Omnitrophota bacterium]MDZ4242586.1 sorbosone dehydrogenase family protein [Candidatus Omnitrophota bacterium]
MLGLVISGAAAEAQSPLPIDSIKLPPGFSISIYADNIPNARSMTLGDKGTLFVGSRTVGAVYAVVDDDKDNKADRVITIAQGLRMPNGVAFRDGSLYVAEISNIWRFDGIEENLDNPPQPVLVSRGFPSSGWHGWKFIRFGPDGKLYVPVGAPCNVCESDDLHFASILRMNPDGSDLKLFARGIRNTVGFDWDPQTRELWFTDNGRDNLGDNMPPDELNHAPQAGMHFGFPYCHGRTINDPEYAPVSVCGNYTPPVQELGPHVASLGMRFYTGAMFPEEYRNQIFIAEHGSWNRGEKLGYRVMLVKVKDNKAVSYEPFAEGWHEGEYVWGRPVDIEIMPDGSMLVSDDHAGAIYRITYQQVP